MALVRRPGPNLADGIVTHQARQPVDVALALAQWEQYRGVLDRSGWPTIEIEPADACPDAVFIEDTMVMLGRHAVLSRPGAASRTGELAGAMAALSALDGISISRIEAPGTLDGGDVLMVGATVYVGRSGRTNDAGIAQLATLAEPLGYDVRPVPVTSVLHLKSAVTALPDGTIVGYHPVVDAPDAFSPYRAMPTEGGAHVVVLAPDHVLMATSSGPAIDLVEQTGVRVSAVDISEFEKLDGCVTCLSVLVPPAAAPTD